MYSTHKRYRKQKYRYTPPTPKACGVLLRHDGHVLVVRKRGKFDVAGGKPRPNEKPHETAWRKFKQETQLVQDMPNPFPYVLHGTLFLHSYGVDRYTRDVRMLFTRDMRS